MALSVVRRTALTPIMKFMYAYAGMLNSAVPSVTIENCRRLGLTNVTVKPSDMFAAVDGKFDIVLAHPPYIPLDLKNAERQ